jgi:hypothetical protein
MSSQMRMPGLVLSATPSLTRQLMVERGQADRKRLVRRHGVPKVHRESVLGCLNTQPQTETWVRTKADDHEKCQATLAASPS